MSIESLQELIDERYKYKKQAERYKNCLDNIHSSFFAIGGPLNDNILQFNNKQLKYLIDIANTIKINL